MPASFRLKKFFTSSRVIALGFAGVILIGSLLLFLPFSSRSGKSCSYLDALFTAVSATCITGLVTVNTATQWSLFGQFVILLMIQIGGMGIVTVFVLFNMAIGGKIGLSKRTTMQNSVSAPKISGILRYTRFIMIGIFSCEAAGALLLSPVFIRDYGFFEGLWMSLFHSVSAFCNAGFDLLGRETPFVSFVPYAGNVLVNVTVMLLIFIGGIGFLTWHDIVTYKFRFRRYSLQSKLSLTTSFVLILLPALWFFFFEFDNETFGNRLLYSLFQSISPRTAGFNSVDLTALSDEAHVIQIFLMLVGGSPGSTAGGMKTTTLALVILTATAVFRRKANPSAFGRRINDGAVKQAMTLLCLYFSLFLVGGIAIARIEGLPLLSCLFETASAVGTVGLTLGITTSLGPVSLFILMALMFLGRVGGLTLIYAAIAGARYDSRLPEEKITIG